MTTPIQLPPLPTTTETDLDEQGMFTRVSYHRNTEGKTVRVTETIRRRYEKVRIPKTVYERRQRMTQNKFGACASSPSGSESGICFLGEDVQIIPVQQKLASDLLSNQTKPSVVDLLTQSSSDQSTNSHLPIHRPGLYQLPIRSESSLLVGDQSGQPGTYQPPHLRTGQSGGRYAPRSGYQLMIKNLSETAKEADLWELCEPFGHVLRVHLPKNRRTQQVRGFAFVSYSQKSDAEQALQTLNGYGYDYLILEVSWADDHQ